MSLFKRNQYELIDDPAPRRGGQKKLLTFTLGGIVILTISLLVILIYLNAVQNPASLLPESNASSTTTEIPLHNSSPTVPIAISTDTVLKGTRNKLRAVGSATGAPGAAAAVEDVLLTIDSGTLRGKYMKSRSGRNYLAFLGIPYAKPPIGELRFKPSVASEPWNGTLDATQFKPECLQKDKYNPVLTTKGSEDCLYLNVFIPKNLSELNSNGGTSRRNRFPVLFYIHGGGQYGSGTRYGANYMMDENVLLVTVHYRLGILGNLNTNDSEARGNQGMKDQVMALEWIHDNIKKFGGDPKKVTIFGNSYGGTEVGGHLISPMSKGLFQRAIMQSGTMLEIEKYPSNTLDLAYELANKLNCTNNINGRPASPLNGTSDLINCFNNVEIDTLVLQSYQMNFEMSVEPSPANEVEENNKFLPDSPLNILQRGELNPADVMAGTSSGEGLFYSLVILADANLTKYFNEHWENAAITALQLESASDSIKIVNSAREFYFGNATLSRNVEANFTNMFSDRSLVHQTYTAATFQLTTNNNNRGQNVYLYYFNKKADKTYAQFALDIYGVDNNNTFLGAGHADELQFLFPYKEYPYIPEGSKNANFSKMMVRLWTTFAESGKPSGADNGEEWLAIANPKPYEWFLIEDEPKMIDWLGPRMEFWDQFNLTDLYRN